MKLHGTVQLLVLVATFLLHVAQTSPDSTDISDVNYEQTTRLDCPVGTYTKQINFTLSCNDCGIGFFCSTHGMMYPEPCPPGTYCNDTRGTVPHDCPAGTFSTFPAATSIDNCTICPSGYYCSDTGATEPTAPCRAGFFCPGGSTSPKACPAGFYQEAEAQGFCKICEQSFYCNHTAKIPCPAGSYCPSLASLPVSCPAGHYCPMITPIPVPCQRGYYCPSSSAEQISCPAGSYCPSLASLPAACPAGTYCPNGTADPVPCPDGYYCPNSSSSPVPCAAGFYCTGQNSCPLPCPVSSYCPSSHAAPVPCPEGTGSCLTELVSVAECVNCSDRWSLPSNSSLFFSPPPCGGYVDGSGTITSPNYPCYYANNENCTWFVNAVAGQVVRLEIISFSTEINYDFLNIYLPDGVNPIYKFGGVVRLTQLTLEPFVIIKFNTDFSITSTGFFLKITSTAPPSVTVQETSEATTILSTNYPSSRTGTTTVATSISTGPRSTPSVSSPLATTQVKPRSTPSPTFLEDLLKNISWANVTAGNVIELAATAQTATSYADSLTTDSVNFASSVVNKMANFVSSGNFTADLYPIPGTIGKIVANLLNANDTVLAYVQGQSKVSIQASLESSLAALAKAATQSGDAINASFLRLQEDNLAFQVIIDSSVRGLVIGGAQSLRQASITPVFTNNTSESTSADLANATVVKLSQSVANNTKTFLIYNNAKLFQTSSSSLNADANTRVLSAQLPGHFSGSQPGLISIVFTGLSEPPNETVRQCGYWNYSTGSWSSDGCKALIIDKNQVECVCDHLTNFAALLAVNEIPENTALDILSTVGLSLSAISLAAVLITFVVIRKMRRTLSQKVLFNLSLSLLALDILFLLGIDSTHTARGCIAVAALLHYFLLTSFMWMLMESILQYLRFVKVLGTYIPRFILKTAIPAWGAPAVIVAIICGVSPDLYYRGNNSYCLARPEVVYYAILLPIGLILVVNWIIFAIVLKQFCCQIQSLAHPTKGSESRLARLHAQAGVCVCTLLGLTWVFGFLTAIPDVTASVAFQWLFCICNTLQGFLIFVFHCLREPTVLKEWKKFCCRTEPLSHRTTMSSSEDSTALSRTTSSTRSHASDSSISTTVQFSSLMPSYKGSYDLSSIVQKTSA